MVAVTGPGEITAPIATTKENTKTEARESVDNFANEKTKRHFTGGHQWLNGMKCGGLLGAFDETPEIWEDEPFEIRLAKCGPIGGFEV